MECEYFWAGCLAKLESELSPLKFETLIKPLSVEAMEEGMIMLLAPNNFVLESIQREKLLTHIEKLAAQELPGTKIVIKIAPTLKKSASTNGHYKKTGTANVSDQIPSVETEKNSITIPNKNKKTHIESEFTFDTLAVGKGNQLAHAIALQITENPGDSAYNPLFVYGGVGVGKTHLIKAIGNKIYQQNPQTNVRYLHAKDYIEHLMHAYRHKAFSDFKNYYSSIDLLLIDDIQFLAGKNRTMEEFFYIFNTLLDHKKQIIMTCDTFPKNIGDMDKRLISRFSWGLTVQIEPPELEMRVAILLKKAEITRVALSGEVAFFIAQHVRANGRELEGALKRVKAFAGFHRQVITIELAKEALRDIIVAGTQHITVDVIQKIVADFYKIPLAEMYSKKRVRTFTKPRQIAMLLSKELTQSSLPAIGKAFGGRDHTTVLYACRTIGQQRQYDKVLSKEVDLLFAMLQH